MMQRLHRTGFTLLEVMIAIVIFTLVMSSLYISFRTAVRAYDIGATHADAEQTARYTVSQVSDDLRNVYYKKKAQYNVMRRQREQLLQQQEQQQLQSGVKIASGEEAELPELGPAIDLSFKATSTGDSGDITFVRLQNLKHGEDRKMWGLARIRYFVSGNTLFRSVDDVKTGETDEEGNELPKPYPPQVDKIAANVKGVKMQFGYWYDGEWKLATDWDSETSQYRNPPLEDEGDGLDTSAAGGYTSSTQPLTTDDLPAWVELTFTFTDPKKTEKEKEYKQIVQIPESQETYVPPDETDGTGNVTSFSNGFNSDRNRGSGGRSGGGHSGGGRDRGSVDGGRPGRGGRDGGDSGHGGFGGRNR